MDLRYAISCEAVGDKGFRVRTHQKTVSLTADSVPSRDEWVKAIRKVIFKAQNMGDSVKVSRHTVEGYLESNGYARLRSHILPSSM